jgi:photosystem II stability/assembly factor-like uncharacterized protein
MNDNEQAGRRGPAGLTWARLRLAATTVGIVVIAAVLLMGRFGADQATPAGTGSSGPTFNLPAALDAGVDQAGLMRTGGIWAVQGSYLLTSTTFGQTWRAGTFPAVSFMGGSLAGPSAVFVLDPDHAWSIARRNVGGSAEPSPTPAGQLFVVDRTVDGGQSWQSTPVSGDFRCDTATISFVDANRGFIICPYASAAAAGVAGPYGAILRTDDGGATWSAVGDATGLGSQFTASDQTTLWSAPDPASPISRAALSVSRDAGQVWAPVDLPGLSSVPAGAEVRVEAGPVFWDPSNGAIAVGVHVNVAGGEDAVRFYRTSDAGRSWTVVKASIDFPMIDFPPAAGVGTVWAARTVGNYNFTVSGDFGATWTSVSGSGLPPNTQFLWFDFADASHWVGTVFAAPGRDALMLSSDGGRTWHPASFGNARAKVSANPDQDPAAAAKVAADFESNAYKGSPPTAWNALSSYSQRAFGSEPAFEAAMTALRKRTNYTWSAAEPTQDAAVRNRLNLTPGVWDDITAFGDWSRAYVVVVSYPGTSEPPETLVVAPLTVTGDWRIWVVKVP